MSPKCPIRIVVMVFELHPYHSSLVYTLAYNRCPNTCGNTCDRIQEYMEYT